MASRGRQPAAGAWEQSAPASHAGPDGLMFSYALADSDAPPAGSVPFDFRGAADLVPALAEDALAYDRCRHYDPTPGLWLTDDWPAPATD